MLIWEYTSNQELSLPTKRKFLFLNHLCLQRRKLKPKKKRREYKNETYSFTLPDNLDVVVLYKAGVLQMLERNEDLYNLLGTELGKPSPKGIVEEYDIRTVLKSDENSKKELSESDSTKFEGEEKE